MTSRSRRRLVWAATVCSALALGAGPPAPGAPQLRLLVPGRYGEDQLPPSVEGIWDAVTDVGTKTALLPAKVRVRKLPPDGPEPEVILESDAPGNVLFLIRGGQYARRDSIPTWFRGAALFAPRESLAIQGPAGARWRVAASAPESIDALRGWTFRLAARDKRTGRTQELGRWMVGVSPLVQWAGDLDGDGGLDLYMHDGTDESKPETWTLYLSDRSRAKSVFGKTVVFSTPED